MSSRKRAPRLWPVIERSLRQLLAEHELVLLEGAGSPAETNLRDTDLANMRAALVADARVVLVADIDRGGAFAHLYGTWALLSEAERGLLAGFVLNKFRGDPGLLPPAPEQLEQLTGVPTLGVIHWLDHGLPDEDGAATPPARFGRRSVAVVRYPTASNLDEFKQLEQVADVRWAGRPEEVEDADLVILPGSKHVAADLAWLVQTGIGAAVKRRARAGRPVLGICGGLQMLGQRLEDGAGVDGSGDGLGLLPLRTEFAASKRTKRTSSCFGPLSGPWRALAGKAITGYEIRHGHSFKTGPIDDALPDGLGFASRSVLGIYLHGLFEQPEVLAAVFGVRPARSLDEAFDRLADAVERHLDLTRLLAEVGIT
jgi:adenosylcobyric acid synthase